MGSFLPSLCDEPMSELPTYQSLYPTDNEPPSYYETPKRDTNSTVLDGYLAEFIANTVIEDQRHHYEQPQPDLTPSNFSTQPQQTSSIHSIISQQQMQAKAEIQGELITRTTLFTVLGILCGLYVPAFIPLVVIGFMMHVVSISYQIMRYKMMFGGIDFNEEAHQQQQQEQQQRENHVPNYRIFRVAV